MRDFGRTRSDEALAGTRPGLSTLAVTLGSLVVVPAVVSRWRAVRRMRECERIGSVGAHEAGVLLALVIVSAALGLVPGFVGIGPVWIGTLVAGTALVLVATFLQRRLNAGWLGSAE